MTVQTIFLIDDDQDDQFVFKDALRTVDAKIIIETAIDGIDALEKLSTSQKLPDLIFVDLNMPRMNGKKFLKEAKSRKQLKEIPVFIYSTSSSPEDRRETSELGAHSFIVKPNNYDELCSILSTVIEGTSE